MERKVIILEKLIKNSECTINQLALLCEVSYKTVQSDIREINQLLGKRRYISRIAMQSGKGTSLNPFDMKEVNSLIEELKKETAYIPEQNEEYYLNHIAFRLLQADYVKIDELCDEFGFSRSTLSRFLPKVKAEMAEWGVDIKSKPHYGLYCSADESKIRQFMFAKLLFKKDEQCLALIGADIADYFLLKESILALARKFDVVMSDMTLEQLFLYVEIIISRLRKKKELKVRFDMEKSSFEYIFSKKIGLQISVFLKREIPEEETGWIYHFIIGKCSKKAGEETGVDYSQINPILGDAFQLIKEKYKYDFEKDIELYTSLSIHFRALMIRARVENYSVNPMLSEVKAYALLAYDMAVDVALLLNERWDIILPDDEISYFAIYFHLAIERKKQEIIQLNILVVCPAGKGMSELAVHFLKKQFKEYLSAIKTCSFYDLKDIDFSLFDYVFTMVPIELEIPIPVVEFALNENSFNMKKIKRQMAGKDPGNMPLLMFSDSKLFFTEIRADDKEGTLRQIIEKIRQHIALSSDFLDSVLRREEIVSTELEYGYAMPHPLDRNMAEKSFFSVTVLPNPIIWKKRKVRIILLTYIKEDMEKLGLFYDSFGQLVTNEEYAISLIEKPTYDNLMDIARNISMEI